jgi:hypothetical protein
MSTFRAHETAIRQAEAIVEALVDRARIHARAKGLDEAEAEEAVRAHVVINAEGVPLQQYGRDTDRVAHVALAQPHCHNLLGCTTWEDIGFERTQDGTHVAHMSGHDYWWTQSGEAGLTGEARFMQYAQAHEAVMEASLEGLDVHIEEEDNLLHVICDETF